MQIGDVLYLFENLTVFFMTPFSPHNLFQIYVQINQILMKGVLEKI